MKISVLLVPCLLSLAACGRFIGIRDTHVRDSQGDASTGPSPVASDARVPEGKDGGQATPGQPMGSTSDGATTVDERLDPPPAPDAGIDSSAVSSVPTADTAGPAPTDAQPAPDARPPDPIDTQPVDTRPVVTGPPLCPTATLPATITLNAQMNGGSCSLPASAIPKLFAAVDSATYANSGACGGCIELANKDRRVVVQVVDKSGESSGGSNSFSISKDALSALAGPNIYNANAQWRWIPCATTGLIMASLRAGSSDFSWAVLFAGYTNRLAKVEYIGKSGAWTTVERLSYNYFDEPKQGGLPTKFRLTDVHNNVVETGPVTWAADQTTPISLGVQFPAPCSLH